MGAQIKRLDGILRNLRRRRAAMTVMPAIAKAFKLSPIHGTEGDCGSSVTLVLPSAEEAAAFAAKDHVLEGHVLGSLDILARTVLVGTPFCQALPQVREKARALLVQHCNRRTQARRRTICCESAYE
jgi:hypothetical protein